MFLRGTSLAQIRSWVNARHTNLALLQTYGSNAWRVHNYVLEATAKQAEKALEDLKQLTVEVNRQRKNTQVCHGSNYYSSLS